MSDKIRISFDAMGGDFAPKEIVEGAIKASKTHGIHALIVGSEQALKNEITKLDIKNASYEIIPSFSVIEMGEKNPAKVMRKKDSSLVIANQLVANGKADAVISAGNTGAATAASLFVLKRINGFERPPICSLIPTTKNKMLLVDAGSNIYTSESQMKQNAILGNIVAKALLKIPKPKLGLLNIGEEPGKGTQLYQDSYEILQNLKSINFIGNVEGKTIIDEICDVAVCDGFTGNIHLKALEGGLKMMSRSFKLEFKRNPLNMLAGLLLELSGSFSRIKEQFDPSSYGGALLGGLKHISIISHGSSDAEAISNAARKAKMIFEAEVIDRITNEVNS